MNNETNIDVQYVSPLKKILMTIGELPTSYLETMSYYEMLVWFTEFLRNQVIPTVNNNAEAVQELQTLYEELRTYVNNYFDNLDVQEEVDNKLDEMAESGQLTDIIAQYLGLAGMITFDTVADMKLAENLVNGSKCATLGYHSVNDGGNAFYKIRQITNDDVVNETSLIAVYDNLLVAELISDEVNLNQFACFGDGIHDDTTALQNAINYAVVNGKTVSSSNDKVYLLSDDITIGNINLDLENCIFKTDNSIIITANEKILNLPKVNAIDIISTNTAVNLYECYMCKVNVPSIYGFNIGLLLSANTNGCVYNNINIQEIRDCITSLKLEATSSGWVNENTFIGGRLWHSSDIVTTYGSSIIKIYLKGSSSHRINNNYFLKQCVEGDEGTSNGLKIKMDYTTSNVFESLRYEGDNPKISITNSQLNLLSNGYNLNAITFTDDATTKYINGISNQVINGGNIGDQYLDIKPSTGTKPVLVTRNLSDNIVNKIAIQGFITCDTSGNEKMRINDSGIQYYENDSYNYIFRKYGKGTLIGKCDGTNRAFVIGPNDNNLTDGCYLWVYNSHLYGKIGSFPSSQSDGTVIL